MTNKAPKPWAVIPAKALSQGKTRLASVLSPENREALNRSFLTRTINVVSQTARLAGIVVVSSDPKALELARTLGVHSLMENEPVGLNHALTLAAKWATEHGASHIMTVSTDLPCLEATDLEAVLGEALDIGAPVVSIAPDEPEQGTNVLVMGPPGAITYAYGPGSYEKHCASAACAGATLRVIRRPGLLFDVDSPEDLAQWRALERASTAATHSDAETASDFCGGEPMTDGCISPAVNAED
ncbi:MAG: 2-phospho-L-lactate guanylyltransferase [Gammaproteobacteria bacterium]|jgi:2-phospho-L-lactate guanylyltransferase